MKNGSYNSPSSQKFKDHLPFCLFSLQKTHLDLLKKVIIAIKIGKIVISILDILNYREQMELRPRPSTSQIGEMVSASPVPRKRVENDPAY